MRLVTHTTITERREWENELTEDQVKLIESSTLDFQHLHYHKEVI